MPLVSANLPSLRELRIEPGDLTLRACADLLGFLHAHGEPVPSLATLEELLERMPRLQECVLLLGPRQRYGAQAC